MQILVLAPFKYIFGKCATNPDFTHRQHNTNIAKIINKNDLSTLFTPFSIK